MVVKRIDAMSLARISGVLYAAIGLVVGGIVAIFAMLGSAMGDSSELGMGVMGGMFMGVGAVIFMPVFYGLMGFVGGLICALLYNVLARGMGGVRIDVESDPAPIA